MRLVVSVVVVVPVAITVLGVVVVVSSLCSLGVEEEERRRKEKPNLFSGKPSAFRRKTEGHRGIPEEIARGDLGSQHPLYGKQRRGFPQWKSPVPRRNS